MSETIVDMGRIFEACKADLLQVEGYMMEMFKSDVELISTIGQHVIKSGGKRMRPLYLVLSARMAGYTGQDHIKLASIIESIHTASLIHDDVVDEAEYRRGNPSANSIWTNQVVVLVGDYMYSTALRHTISFMNDDINETLSAATTRMTQGELLQLQKSNDTGISEDEYFRVVSCKTGALISAAASIGGIIAGCSKEEADALAAFGLSSGNAFQVVDDILDYMADEEELGKSIGKDMDEGKVTLPMIYLLRQCTESEKTEIKAILDNGLTDKGLARIIALFKQYDALQEAMEKANSLVADAKKYLQIFDDNEARQMLFQIADYALQRKK